MNSEILKNIKELQNDILDEPLIKKYIVLKEIYDNSIELKSLRNKIKSLKNCHIKDEEKVEYYRILKEYNNNPLVIEFKNVSDDVCNFLEEIKKEIEL